MRGSFRHILWKITELEAQLTFESVSIEFRWLELYNCRSKQYWSTTVKNNANVTELTIQPSRSSIHIASSHAFF
jgi:hypothetical protein